MKKLLPNVYWLEGRGSNFYLTQDEDGLTLIDSGMPKQETLVWQALQELGRQPQDLKRILLTHADIDHVGSTAVIQAQSGAKVYAGEATAELVRNGRFPDHGPRFMQWIMKQFMSYTAVPAQAIEIFHAGDTLPILGGLEVIATPGHTLDHHSFYSAQTGVLFAGDALNTRNKIQSSPPIMTADMSLANQSAMHLLGLSPALIACGHGAPSHNHTADDVMALFNQLRQS